MKKVLLFCVFLQFCVFYTVCCQSGKAQIKFSSLEHDFGKIFEDNGPVSYEFVFSNDGNLPLIISNVQPSCGCTTPEWTREPVVPGKLGSIDVSFNPAGRPGPFVKTITISSNAEEKNVVLKIRGYVNSSAKSFADFRYSMGDLKLLNVHAAMGVVYKGESKVREVQIANSSADRPLAISFKNVPGYITIMAVPPLLKPNERGIIRVTYNSGMVDDWDYVIDRLELSVNSSPVPDNIFTVTAVVREDFSKLTAEELNNAPKISFDKEKIDFGTIKPDASVKKEFLLRNAGKSDLIIRKIRATCGCTVAEPDEKIIPPGKSTVIKTSFNPKGKSGSQKYAITVITNDPKNYKKLLWIEGTVVNE